MTNYTKTNVLQLREKLSRGLQTGLDYVNGSYESEFNSLTLNDGDMCELKSLYLDTAESSAGKITIKPNETDFSVSFYHYIMNWTDEDKIYNQTAPPSTAQPDGKNYYLCDSKAITGGNTKKVMTITLNEMRGYGVGSWGDAGVVFQYVDATQSIGNQLSFFTLNVPNIKHDPTDKITFDVNSVDKNGHNLGLGFLINGNFPIIISQTRNDIKNLESVAHSIDCGNIQITTADNDDGDTRTPHQFTFNFTIPQGGYDPSELARIIDDKCSVLRTTQGLLDNYPMSSPFLTSTRQFNTDYPQPANETFYVSEDGEDYYNYTSPNDYLSGTSEFGLKYDVGQDKFQFETLNNPFYVNSQPSLESVQIGTSGEYFVINKNCGIAFTALSPPNVWFKKMGFDPSICVSYESRTKTFSPTITNQTLPIIKGAIEGVSLTGTYKGLDTAIYKTGGTPSGGVANAHGQRAFTSAELASTPTTSLNQIIIYADYQVAQIKYDYAYYMIEIDLGFQQSFMGQNYSSNKIQSVIGRFYSKDSFTNAYNEGSIPYIHRGKSIKIDKARIRILNDDGDPADDIGDNNTIFLEIIKNVNPPSLQIEPIPLQDYLDIEKESKKVK